LLSGRIIAIEKPYFFGPGERLNRQVRVWTLELGADARSILLDFPVGSIASGFQKVTISLENVPRMIPGKG
jgi:hypothetical protein